MWCAVLAQRQWYSTNVLASVNSVLHACVRMYAIVCINTSSPVVLTYLFEQHCFI